MKGLLRLLFVFVLIGIFAADAWAAKPKILQLKDLQPGTPAIGFSVFKGIEPEPFDVVLGEVVNQLGSGFILAKISGGPMDTPLEKIGAIAGMSGSPVFIGCTDLDDCTKNGILVGALSYSIGYFIEGGMNCLLTPAEYMLGARVDGYVAAAQLSSYAPDQISVGGRKFVNLMLLPKTDNLAVQIRAEGQCGKFADSELKPGSMVTVFLAKGLVPYGGSGTVTWRDDDKIYIFGHSFFGSGMVNYPFVHVAVADTVQTPYQAYKEPGCSLKTEGAMLVDGTFEMAGVIGRTVSGIPLYVELRLGDGGAVLEEEIIPSPIARKLINVIPAVWAEQLLGNMDFMSVAYQTRIAIKDESGIFLKNIIPAQAERDPFSQLFKRIDAVFANLQKSRFRYKVEGIWVRVDFVNNLKVWKNKKAFLSQNKASPGETVFVNVILEEVSSGATRQMSIPVKVPGDFMERLESEDSSIITVLIQGGSKFTDKKEQTEVSVKNFINQLNQAMNYEANVLYVQQIMAGSKAQKEADRVNAKASIKPAWKWTDVEEGDLKQLPLIEENEVVLTLSPSLNDFIDLDLTFKLQIETKEDMAVKDGKAIKHRKWFLFYLF